jgi:F0F1-type ATP synthase assembly protein I
MIAAMLKNTGFVPAPLGAYVMDRDKRDLLKSLYMVSSMGISVVLAIGMGVWFGLTLDRWLGTKPWFFYIFLFIGIAAGFKNIYVITGREIRKDDDSDQRG